MSLPNPLLAAGTIRFQVPEDGARVTLRIHDLLGRVVRTLVDGARPAGAGEVAWDGRSDRGERLAPGLYVCRLQQGQRVLARKLAVVRRIARPRPRVRDRGRRPRVTRKPGTRAVAGGRRPHEMRAPVRYAAAP